MGQPESYVTLRNMSAVPSRSALFSLSCPWCFTLFRPNLVPFHPLSFHSVLLRSVACPVLFCSVLFCSVLFCSFLLCPVPSFSVGGTCDLQQHSLLYSCLTLEATRYSAV